jgi:prevent-host-death family protein
MEREKASVAQAKNTLSSLINKVAYGKTRVLLESRGKPKAALVSAEDLARLEQLEREKESPESRFHTLAQAQALRRKIYRRRKKALSDSAKLLNRLREQRDRGL